MDLGKRIKLFVLLIFAPLLIIWVFQEKLIVLNGQTMGTFYSIKIYTSSWRNKNDLKNEIETQLNQVSKIFSTWDDSSELSTINNLNTVNAITISNDLYTVLNQSKELFNISKGYYDPTLKPLVDIWGFSSNNSYNKIPTDLELKEVSRIIGFDKIELTLSTLTKKNPETTIDLSSIAKGYAVDKIAVLLESLHVKKYMIEIGGEIRVKSSSQKDQWIIGIQEPSFLPSNNLLLSLKLQNNAVATSGDYKNYFEKEGIKYPHIINPILNHPIINKIASVTVIAPHCMLADGLATALMVSGVSRGLSIVESYKGVECIFLVREDDGSLTSFLSTGFNHYIEESAIEI